MCFRGREDQFGWGLGWAPGKVSGIIHSIDIHASQKHIPLAGVRWAQYLPGTISGRKSQFFFLGRNWW
ncbi:hypothetical protein MLD38_007187 [Melastoma candidum]|uniref:Uncharacterized protein n=1 Tax=Melastoma candidum TaxID=119954 RepID=A0ACB9RPZ7_9MYRT|nr:hypothetical protein MLD38_007187 [Melastoma candidum]